MRRRQGYLPQYKTGAIAWLVKVHDFVDGEIFADGVDDRLVDRIGKSAIEQEVNRGAV